MKSISARIWTQAFIIGILGSLIFKMLEVLVQSITFEQIPYLQIGAYGGSTIIIIVSQLIFLILVSSFFIFLLMQIFRRLWIVSFVPFLYYLIKEAYNMIFVVHLFTWTHPVLEISFALLAIPLGFGVYYLLNKIFFNKRR